MPLRDAIAFYATDADRAEIARERAAKIARSKTLRAEAESLWGRDPSTKVVSWYDHNSAKHWRLRLDEDLTSEGLAAWATANPDIDYPTWFADRPPITTKEGRARAAKLYAEGLAVSLELMTEKSAAGALAAGLQAKLREGAVVALGRLPPHFAVQPIPAADWAGEWRFDPLNSTAAGGVEPTKISDIRILPPGAPPTSNPRGAGAKPNEHWPAVYARLREKLRSKDATDQPKSMRKIYDLVRSVCSELKIDFDPKDSTIKGRLEKDCPELLERLRAGGWKALPF